MGTAALWGKNPSKVLAHLRSRPLGDHAPHARGVASRTRLISCRVRESLTRFSFTTSIKYFLGTPTPGRPQEGLAMRTFSAPLVFLLPFLFGFSSSTAFARPRRQAPSLDGMILAAKGDTGS